jgi:hypothetical protein
MKRTKLVFALALSMAAGCSTTQQVQLSDRDPWMAKAQGDLLNKDAKVILTDGSTIEGTIVGMNADSLSVKGAHDGKPYTEPLDRVSSIGRSPSVWPAIGGVFGGALVGTFIGAGISMGAESPRIEMLGLNTITAGVGGAAIGALLGAVAGGVGLGLATSVTDYTFLPAPSRKTPTGPASGLPDSLRTGK